MRYPPFIALDAVEAATVCSALEAYRHVIDTLTPDTRAQHPELLERFEALEVRLRDALIAAGFRMPSLIEAQP